MTSTRNKSTFPAPVRLQDVASAAGISLATASLAMNGKGRVSPATQRKVRRIASRMGFEAHPSAQRLASGRASTQIVLFTRDLDLGVATKKLQLLQGVLFDKGFNASIHSCGFYKGDRVANHAGLIRDLRRQRPLGIICYNTHHFDDEMFAELRQYAAGGGHLVTFDLPSILECDQVIFDRSDSADQAMTHLLELGHREIGFAMPGIHADTIRTDGLHAAFNRYGLTVRQELLFDCVEGIPHEEIGERLARDFLHSAKRPSAMCIPDDVVAASFVAALYRHGVRVPEDLSVVSHDDMPIAAHNFVPLTTVAQPMEVIARETVEMLLSRIENRYDGPIRTVRLRGEFVVRESTAPFS